MKYFTDESHIDRSMADQTTAFAEAVVNSVFEENHREHIDLPGSIKGKAICKSSVYWEKNQMF